MPDILITPIDPLGTGRTPASGRGDSSRVLASLEAGDVLTAQIVARLPGGIYRVAIGGQQLRMALPDYLTPGQTVELRVVTSEPQLTFALKEATAPSLSSAARLLSALAPQSGALTAAPLASTAEGLVASAPEMSAVLQQSLVQSGLFYESHLAQWLAGDRNLSEILEEPQARITKDAKFPGSSPASSGNVVLPLDAQALNLVQYQLAALDSSRVLLQFEVWPGQWLRWEVEEAGEEERDKNRPDAGSPDSAPAWRTRLEMVLPQLGALSARLTLGAQGLDVQVDAAEPASTDLLQVNRLALQRTLAEAGLPTANIAIRHHGTD